MAHPYLRELWKMLPAVALLAAYAPLYLASLAIAPVVAYSLFGGDHLFLLALYTVLSYSVPVALVGVRVLERYRRIDAPRTRRALMVLSAVNWFPLCATVAGWVILKNHDSFVP
jgi:hypothetical protein